MTDSGSILVRPFGAAWDYRLAASGIVDWHATEHSDLCLVTMSRAKAPILVCASVAQMTRAYAALHATPCPNPSQKGVI